MPSSVIEWMRYEPRYRALLISFRNERSVYCYFGVERREWTAFVEAASKGTYLNREFKRQEHPYERLNPNEARRVGRLMRGRAEFIWPRPDPEMLS